MKWIVHNSFMRKIAKGCPRQSTISHFPGRISQETDRCTNSTGNKEFLILTLPEYDVHSE